jgi:hypothetical protein
MAFRAWFFVLVLALGCMACSSGPQIVICEQAQARIVILDADADWNTPEALTWEWRARETESLAEAERAWFEHPTDAKPVLGGDYLLITASGGGVALLRIRDQALLFRAFVGGNPHSAELLPDGAIVTASSTGSQLQLWKMEQPEQAVQSLAFSDAHGVAWDPQTARLWALGDRELIALSYLGKDARDPLQIVERFTLPSPGGHDLSRDRSGGLLLSTHTSCFRFDPVGAQFWEIPALAGIADIKSISEPQHLPKGLPTVYVRAETSWWSDNVASTQPDWQRQLVGSHIYKARWMYETPPPRREPRFQIGIGFGVWLGVDPD